MEMIDKESDVLDVAKAVEELVLNSIDAKASEIIVSVSWSLFTLSVNDNGCGMSKEELENITSNPAMRTPTRPVKASSQKIYGYLGQALSSIELVSREMCITSRQPASKITLKKVVSLNCHGVTQSSEDRPNSGTTITVFDYLYNFPKLRAMLNFTSQMKHIQTLLQSLALVHCRTCFSVLNEDAGMLLFKSTQWQDTLQAARHWFQISKNGKLVSFHKSTKHFKIKGLVMEAHCNTTTLYTNYRPVSSFYIECLINDLFINFQLDKFFSIILNVKCSRSSYHFKTHKHFDCIKFAHWNELRQLLTKTLSSARKSWGRGDVPFTKMKQCGSILTNGTFQTPQTTSYSFQDSLSLKTKEMMLSEASEAAITLKDPDPSQTMVLQQPDATLWFGELPGCSVSLGGVKATEVRYRSSPLINLPEQHTLPGPKIIVNDWEEPEDSLTNQDLSSVPLTELEEVPKPGQSEIKPDDSEVKKTNPQSEQTVSVPPSKGIDSLTVKRRHSETNEFTRLKLPKLDAQPWMQIDGDANAYYVNTLSGNTSKLEPLPNEPLFELRAPRTFRAERKTIDLGPLDALNEFWVHRQQPLNISRSSANSFAFHIELQRPKCRMSRQLFDHLYVVDQVDRKFVACLTKDDAGLKYLILVDQHAAHERVCLEKLIGLHSTIEDDGEVQIHSAPLRSPLRLTLDGGRADAVRAISTKWSRLGLKLTVQANVVEVTAVPSCFLAREASCRQLTETLIEESLAQVLVYGRVSSCILPPSIRNVLNSIACRGAIKFGDVVSRKRCIQLLGALGQCDVPFQCAHGRPLLVPLLQLDDLEKFTCANTQSRPQYQRLHCF